MTMFTVVEFFNRSLTPLLNALLGEGTWDEAVTFEEHGFSLSLPTTVIEMFHYITCAIKSAYSAVAHHVYICDDQRYVAVTGDFRTT